MSRDWYFAPAGSGTSGSGSRNSPIVGLATLGSIGIAEGDTIITLSANFEEQFVVPQNNIRIISENSVFDGTYSLSGSNTINSSYVEGGFSAWQLVDTGLNVWKKGLHTVKLLIKDGEFLEPMSSSAAGNSSATILGAIAENEWTLRTESLDGISYAVYLRLPAGENPSTANIRCSSPRRYAATNIQTGAFIASEKEGITLEGLFQSRGVNQQIGTGSGFFFDRCIGLDNRNGKLSSEYDYFPTYIVAGDGISITADAQYCYNAIQIAAANHASAVQYAGGDIRVYDCVTDHCGWLPYFTGLVFAWTDADGGVAVGQEGGTVDLIEILNGRHTNSGPSVRANKAGWNLAASTIGRGWGIIAGTTKTMSIGKIKLVGNVIDGGNGGGMTVGGVGITKLKTVIESNIVKNVTAPAYSQAPSFIAQSIYVDEGVLAHPASEIILANNISTNNTVSNDVFQARRYNAGSTIKMINNVSQNNTLETGFSSYGHFRIVDTIATGRTITANITDGPIGGVYGRLGATSYATKALFDAAVGGVNIEGTVVVNDDYSLTSGTANPIGTGVKYWGTYARPNDLNGNPLPDISIDIGPVQGNSHPFHPVNLKKV